MDLGLWGSLWANCALGATILTLPAAQLVQGAANVNFGASMLPQNSQVDSQADIDPNTSSEDDEEDGEDDDLENETTRSETKSLDEENQMADNANEDTMDSECASTTLTRKTETKECKEEEEESCENESTVEKNTSSKIARKRNVVSSSKKGKKYKNNLQRIRYSREEYRCTLCPYTCTTEKAFFKHLRSCESKDKSSGTEGSSDEPRLSCPVCGKDRNGEDDLSEHMRKHKDNRHFCCDICAFRTVQLKKLIQHRRMHTGERPHLCPHCSYRSARRDNLRSHVRRVHKKENLTCDTFSPRGMLLAPSRSK